MIRCSEEASFGEWQSDHAVSLIREYVKNALRALFCAGRGVKHAMQRATESSVFLEKMNASLSMGPKPCLRRTLPSAFCCICERMETAQSLGNGTHAAVNIG